MAKHVLNVKWKDESFYTVFTNWLVNNEALLKELSKVWRQSWKEFTKQHFLCEVSINVVIIFCHLDNNEGVCGIRP